jgi:hypothetical protein
VRASKYRLAVARGGLGESDPHLVPNVLAVGHGGRALGDAHDVCGGAQQECHQARDDIPGVPRHRNLSTQHTTMHQAQ